MLDNSLLTRDLKLNVITNRHPQTKDFKAIQTRVYDFWHRIWLKTFDELNGEKQLYSDDFHRQDEITFLTYRGEVISYFSFSFFDLSLRSHAEHSYFKNYPADVLAKLNDMGLTRVMTMGWFAVSPEWRKSSRGKLIAEAQLAMGYKRYLESDCDALIAFARNNRKVNELCYMYGSRCIKADQIVHHVSVDFLYTLKNEVRSNPDPSIASVVDHLWANRIIHNSTPAKDSGKVAA